MKAPEDLRARTKKYALRVIRLPYHDAMQLQRFWASNCSDLQLQSPSITAKHAT